jgi:hypothetical protein
MLQNSSVQIVDDEGVSPSSSVITRVLAHVLCTCYVILSKTAPNLKKR